MNRLRQRLGIPETASIGLVIDALQKGLQTTQDVVKFGMGEGTVDLNVTKAIKDIKDEVKEYQDKRKEDLKSKGRNKGLDAIKKKQAAEREERKKQAKNVDGVKPAKDPTKPLKAQKPKPAEKPKKPDPPKQAKRPDNKLTKRATKETTLSGKTVDGGKATKITISKGSSYSIYKTSRGIEIHRRGQKPVIISPADAKSL